MLEQLQSNFKLIISASVGVLINIKQRPMIFPMACWSGLQHWSLD